MTTSTFPCKRQFSVIYHSCSTQLIHLLSWSYLDSSEKLLPLHANLVLLRRRLVLAIRSHRYGNFVNKSHDSHVSPDGGVLAYLHLMTCADG